MGLDVRKINREGQIAAIDQDVFQDVRMLTAGWDAVGGRFTTRDNAPRQSETTSTEPARRLLSLFTLTKMR